MKMYIFIEFNEYTAYGDFNNIIPKPIAELYSKQVISVPNTKAFRYLDGHIVCFKSLWNFFTQLTILSDKEFLILDMDFPDDYISNKSFTDDYKQVYVFDEIDVSYLTGYALCKCKGSFIDCISYIHNTKNFYSLPTTFRLGALPDEWNFQDIDKYIDECSQKACSNQYTLLDAIYACKKETGNMLTAVALGLGYKKLNFASLTVNDLLSDKVNVLQALKLWEDRANDIL